MSNQGRHGEAKFQERCLASDAKVKAIVNPSIDDQHGWDHIVEIEPSQKFYFPADLKTNIIQCFVQVKTTACSKATTKLKLSNAIKSAKSPFPTFVFLLKYKIGSNEPEFYAKHVWEDEISAWLFRARETENSKNKDLHKIVVTVAFSEHDRIHCNPVDWMFENVSKYGGEQYPVEKSKIFQSVGYKNFPQTGTIVLPSSVSKSDLVLHELGLIADIPLEEFRLYDNRFGIRTELPSDLICGGRLAISREPMPLILHIQSVNGNVFEMPALARASSLVSFDDPAFRIRATGGDIDLIASPVAENQEITLTYNLESQHRFLEKLGFLCFVNWSHKGVLQIKAVTDIGNLFLATVNKSFDVEPWMPHFEAVGHHILNVLGREKCAEILISYRELSPLVNSLHFVTAILESAVFRFEAEFEGVTDPFEKLVGYSYGKIGDWSFGSIIEATLDTQYEDGPRRGFVFKSPKLVRKIAFKQGLDEVIEAIRIEFDCYKKSLKVPAAMLEGGDLIKWAKLINSDERLIMDVDCAS